MMFYLRCVLVLLVLFLALPNSWSAQIKAIKGKKLLIEMQDEKFKKGEILRIENPEGKSVGVAKVLKTKNNLAQAIFKGKAQVGYQLKIRNQKTSPDKKMSSSTSRSMFIGGMVGFNSVSSDIELPSGAAVNVSGTGFSLKGLVDATLTPWLSFRGLLGLEQFIVGGASNEDADGCSGECTAEINYLALDMWARYVIGSGKFRPWFGVAFDIMFPLSKESTAISEDSITNTSLYGFGGGLDWFVSSDTYIPIQLEYKFYPSSDEVNATAISARVGYTLTF